VTVNAPIPSTPAAPLTSIIDMPQDFIVEHVEIVVNAQHAYRGDISISLESPGGTVSRMMEDRERDSDANYTNWHMSSVANWGEHSAGQWTLSVWDDFAGEIDGTFTSWKLIVHGHSAGGAPQELLVNGGFETELEPAWSVKDSVGDKIKSNKDTKVFAYTGENAFRFKGNDGAAGKLVQKIDGAALTNVFAGDTITFSGWYNTTANVGKFGVVKVGYEDEDLKTKLELSGTATTAYTPVGVSSFLEANPTKIKVILKYENTSGKLYVDDLSLRIGAVSRSTGALDLPGGDAPVNNVSPDELLPLP
jgi:subtilisin-like proprotein convertase family protein